jgi:hypothetical protein
MGVWVLLLLAWTTPWRMLVMMTMMMLQRTVSEQASVMV